MVLNVRDGKQLFLEDDFIVESAVGIRRVMHRPTKHPENPLIVADKPWEEWGLNYLGTVMYDDEEGIYKMWYASLHKRYSYVGRGKRCVLQAYAASKDAVHWEKPNLGVAEFEGSKENNIISFDAPSNIIVRSTSVIKDVWEKDPNKRYKMIFQLWEITEGEDPLGAAYSRDGIRWRVLPTPIWSDARGFDTNNTVFWDPRINKYVAYIRRWMERPTPAWRKRHVGRMESDDFVHWTTPDVVLGPDDDDPPDSDLYTPPAFKYTDAENAYFLLPSFFDWRRNQIWIQLATSRDGVHWRRAGNREPFIPLGHPGTWDSECLYACGTPLIVNDKIYFYYMGYNIGHDAPFGEKNRRAGGYGLATLRLDGFISLDAGRNGGVITTRPLQFKGSLLELNVEAPYGKVEVELLDEKGDKPLPEYTREDCDNISVDSVSHRATWKGNDSLEAIADETIRLRIYLQLARIYAFRFK